MEYRQLGRAGVRVSALCLGAMNFGGRTSKEDGIKITHAALDAGVNFIDTANVYTGGRSEEIVGAALKGRRDDVVLATKVFSPIGQGINDRGTSRFAIMREVERSLTRLKTNHIDLYQLHRADLFAPPEETFSALNDLVHQGKVRYIGVSTFPAWQTAQAQGLCARNGWVPISTEQPPYSMVEREVEKELVPCCRAHGIGILPWSPLGGGLLSDKFVGGKQPKDTRVGAWPIDQVHWRDTRKAVDKLAKLADRHGTTLSRFALAWVRDADGVTSPIIGPRTMAQLKDALASTEVTLDAKAREAVDEIVAPQTSLWMKARVQDWARGLARPGAQPARKPTGKKRPTAKKKIRSRKAAKRPARKR